MAILKDLQDIFQTFAGVFRHSWFFILPWLLYFLFKPLWMNFVIGKYMGAVQYAFLEIIPPREIEKSPKLMESFFAGFAGVHQGYNAFEIYKSGMILPRLSIEIVSDGGKVHFYMRIPKANRNLIEANLYAQYPDVQIVEAEDYVNLVPKIIPNKDWNLWGSDLELSKPDIWPIKTYHNFEEDITGKMIDPLSALIEVLGKISPEEKIWFQIVIYPESEAASTKEGLDLVQVVTGRKKKAKGIFEKVWIDITDVFSNIITAMMGSEVAFTEEKKEVEQPLEFKLTPGEKDALKALEENVGRIHFVTKMRFIYMGKKSVFSKATVSSFFGAMKQFNSNNLNSLKPNNLSKTKADFVAVGPRLRFKQIRVFKRYVSRDMDGAKFKLSTAELATIFHMPDMSVMAPGINRVDAKRGGAPFNLPIE